MKETDPRIPKGPYCYPLKGWNDEVKAMETNCCPYWSLDHTKPYQDNGYCLYMGKGDWEVDRMSLLWDQVKECGINDDDDDFEDTDLISLNEIIRDEEVHNKCK